MLVTNLLFTHLLDRFFKNFTSSYVTIFQITASSFQTLERRAFNSSKHNDHLCI